MKFVTILISSALLIISCSTDKTEASSNTEVKPTNVSIISDTVPSPLDSVEIVKTIDLSIFGQLEYKGDNYSNLGNEISQLESLGGIQLGQEQHEVIMAIGKPDSIIAAEYWPVDGGEHSYWIYKELGLTIELMNIEGKKPSYVQTIELLNSAALSTTKGINIGSYFNNVVLQYSEELMYKGCTISKELISFGEGNYSMLIFEFENNNVSRIYLGPTVRC